MKSVGSYGSPTNLDIVHITLLVAASRCQKAAWKDHKTSCDKKSPPGREELDLAQVWGRVSAAHEINDWQGVLTWEGHMEALLARAVDDKKRVKILAVFAYTHSRMQQHAKAASCFARKADLLGGLQLCRDQVMPKAYVSEHPNSLVKGGLVSTETILKAIPGPQDFQVFCIINFVRSRVQISPPPT